MTNPAEHPVRFAENPTAATPERTATLMSVLGKVFNITMGPFILLRRIKAPFRWKHGSGNVTSPAETGKKLKNWIKRIWCTFISLSNIFFIRDTLYMLCETEAVIDGNAFNRIALLSTPLDSSEEFTVLWEDYVTPERHPAIRFMGQYIYIEAGVNSSKVDIYRFDTATGTVETLLSDENSDLCYGEIGIDENGTLYLSSADEGTTGYVWKIANGQKEEIMTLPVNSYSPPDILDGYVASVCSGADRYKELTVKSLIGEQIYSGPLFTETIPDIPGDPNACSYGCVGNQGTVINYSLSYDTEKLGKEFIVSFDAAQTMKPVLVWHSEDVKYG